MLKKHIIVIVLILLAIFLSYSFPKAKYVGTGFISELQIPVSIKNWAGRDVTQEVGLNLNSSTYDFVSEAVAYQYINTKGKSLLFIILDAGNFHHPKVCFTGAGFKITELSDMEFKFPDRTLKTHALFTEKGKQSYLSYYWIVIDRNVAHKWIEQKFKQLLFSLFGKQRVGLMVRIDVPASKDTVEEASALARQFMHDIIPSIPDDQADYILGSKSDI